MSFPLPKALNRQLILNSYLISSNLILQLLNLPDASQYEEETFTATLLIGSKAQQLTFSKKPIQRGSQLVYRWIYEGKILIRNKDKESVS